MYYLRHRLEAKWRSEQYHLCKDFCFMILFYLFSDLGESMITPFSWHTLHSCLLLFLFQHHYIHNVLQCAEFLFFIHIWLSSTRSNIPLLVPFIPVLILSFRPTPHFFSRASFLSSVSHFLLHSPHLSLLGQRSELLLISYSSSYFA